MRRSIVGALGLLLVVLAARPAGSAPSGRLAVTAETVESLGGNISSVRSKVSFAPYQGLLLPGGPLGYLGPMGPLGPLAAWGPLSNWIMSPANLMKGMPNFEAFARVFGTLGGDMSEEGPLGPHGPLSRYKDLSDPDPTRFGLAAGWTNQLQAGGLLTPLGPLGFMSPRGAFGPAGVVGDHAGYEIDSSGNYLDARKKVRRTFKSIELYEDYTEAHALSLRDNDTSFTVSGRATWGEVRAFEFTSRHDQIVTIVLLPQAAAQIWGLRVTTPRGSEVLRSLASVYVNWAQFQVKKGEKLNIEVALRYTPIPLIPSPYGLYVTGAGPDFNRFEVFGDHVLSLDWR